MERSRGQLIAVLVSLVLFWALIVFFGRWVYGWEELTVWDNDWSSSSEVRVTPYSKWDSQTGNSYGYVYDYRPYSNRILPPAERELERQEFKREDWWGDEYKEWLDEQGVSKGEVMGW